MSLQKKTLLILTITIASLLGGFYILSSRIFLQKFIEIEQTFTLRNAQRVNEAYKDTIETLSSKIADWADWDDAYHFMQTPTPEFIRSNINAVALHGLRINYMVFIDKQKSIRIGAFDNLDAGEFSTESAKISQDLVQLFSPDSPLFRLSNPEDTLEGLLQTEHGPLIIAVHPILTSEKKGPVNGYLLFGRFLDKEELARLNQITHVSISSYPISDIRTPPSLDSTQPYIHTLSDKTIASYIVVSDVFGKPSQVFQTVMTRDIFQQGMRSVKYFIIAICVVGGIFGLVVMGLLNILILSPLSSLTRALGMIGISGNLSSRLPHTHYNDEISHVSTSINRMLDDLEHAQHQIQFEKDKAQQYLEIARVFIIVLDKNGSIQHINSFAAKRLGYTKPELLGKSWFSTCVPEDQRKQVRDIFQQMISENTPAFETYETDVLKKDGSISVIRWNNTVLRDELGHIIATLSSGEDVTAQKKIEDQLKKHVKEVETLNKLMVGRELRMVEIKKELETLKQALEKKS